MDPYCKDLGINLTDVLSSDYPYVKHLTNGSVIEIFNFCQSNNFDTNAIVKIIAKITKTENIASKACIAKIYRIIKQDKEKRGSARDNIRKNIFTIPTESSSNLTSTDTSTFPSEAQYSSVLEDVKTESLEVKLKDRRQKVEQFRELTKQLKRKLDRREKNIEEKAQKKAKLLTKEQESEVKVLKQKNILAYGKLQRSTRKHSMTLLKKKQQDEIKTEMLKNTRKEVKSLERQLEAVTKENNDLRVNIERSGETINEYVEKTESLKKTNEDLNTSLRYVEALIGDSESVDLFDSTTNSYSNEVVECAINLTNLKVATRNVGPVIKEVAKLCGRNVKNIPSRQAVDTFVDRKVALAHKQIGEIASSANTTLYTDETRKHGHTYETYIISDQENSYILGLREMANKSGATTMDTFKEILQDLSDHCSDSNFDVGNELLKNIKNTMSDRASTEKTFNNLLTSYRNECLPLIFDNYDELADDQKDICGKINNFFCGLHLLVAMADVCESSLKQFEKNYEPEDIGSAANSHLKRYHKSESGTLRLLRTCSKVCAAGEDEKSGAHLPWKTFLTNKNLKNYILRFRHNRFNMIFMVGGAVYFHAEDLAHFLEHVHGTSNDLLKAVNLDVKENLYVAGAKALGLISKFITAPLWRLIELPGHIMDINQQFKTLTDFFELAANDAGAASQFMTGEVTPFQTIIDDTDVIMKKLIASSTVDEITLPMLQHMFTAIKQMLIRMVPEHLPGGKFWEPSESLLEETKSAKKHNKMPEFVFGQLDHLVSFRPNASLLANEAYIMYSFNKTSEWLANLPDEEKYKYIDESRKEARNIRQTFKARIKEIEEKRLQQQRQKQAELERKEQERLRKAEALTNDVCYYGLWQSREQVEEGLTALSNDKKEIEAALKAQLLFRKNLLNQKPAEKKFYSFSKKDDAGKYKKLSNEELKQNLLMLVQSAAEVDVSEVKEGKIPLFVGKTVNHTFEDKRYRGKVINIVPGFPDWYNVIYEGDEAIYVFNLKEDYKKGDVQIVVN